MNSLNVILNVYLIPAVGVTGLTLNLVSILAFTGALSKRKRSSSLQIFLVALCTFDMVQLAFSSLLFPPTTLHAVFARWKVSQNISDMRELVSPRVFCNVMRMFPIVLPVFYPLLMTASFASIWTMVCITFQRFRAICYPLQNRASNELRNARVAVVFIALFSCGYNLLHFLHFAWKYGAPAPQNASIDNYDCHTVIQLDLWFKDKSIAFQSRFKLAKELMTAAGYWLVPLIILTTLNVRMTVTILKARSNTIKPLNLNQKLECRAILMIGVVGATFLTCHSVKVYNTINILMGSRISATVNDFNNILVNINSCLNPVIYILFTQRFRNLFWEQISAMRNRRSNHEWYGQSSVVLMESGRCSGRNSTRKYRGRSTVRTMASGIDICSDEIHSEIISPLRNPQAAMRRMRRETLSHGTISYV